MIEKVKVKSIETISGTSKSGRGYNMVILMTEDGRKMSMYCDKEYDLKLKKVEQTAKWRAGDEVTVRTEENGTYLNFDLPSKLDMLEARVERLEKLIKK